MNDVKQQQKFREQEELSTRQRAVILGLQYFDTREVDKKSPLIKDVLSNEQMYKGRFIPLQRGNDDQSIVFGITSSTPQSLLRQIREQYNQNSVTFVMISNEGFREYMSRYDPPRTVVYDDVKISEEGDSATLSEVSKTLESVRTDDILSYLIVQADRLNASDIHIECQRTDVRIRLRVDGTLHSIARITHDKYRVLQQSIASKADISTASQDAQTGHLQQEVDDPNGEPKLLNMRIETVPTVYGQDAVIRLFNFDESLLNLKNLGLSDAEMKVFEDVIAHPHGMVLVVGPTGSGKSTTLYSILNALNQPTRKILTLEDPVEYSINGVSQVPVNTQAGDSFAEKLRASLRLDPDVLMVGEIRDLDTAKTAIQASLTGHLVLATFHADDASAALSRMIDMLGQNPIFSTAIRLIIGQRLVRQLDDDTKTPYEPDEATKKWIRSVLADLPKGFDVPKLDKIQLYQPGTSAQNPFGYKGRSLILEQMVVSREIRQYLRASLNDLDNEKIESTAKDQGMITMLQDGVLKAINGQTSLEEINRVL